MSSATDCSSTLLATSNQVAIRSSSPKLTLEAIAMHLGKFLVRASLLEQSRLAPNHGRALNQLRGQLKAIGKDILRYFIPAVKIFFMSIPLEAPRDSPSC
jgi:hypothetical protein